MARAQRDISLLADQTTTAVERQLADTEAGIETEGIPEFRANHDVPSMTYAERKEHLLGVFIEYPDLQIANSKIQESHENGLFYRGSSSAEPECLFIAGESHTGKSALITKYLERFPRAFVDRRTRVPVLSVVLPSTATPKNVAIEVLQALGDPNAERGTTAALSSRVANFIRDCGVELLVFDELHHFINHETERILLDTSEWLKTLIIQTKVPVVALGKPAARSVIDYNEQLRRRFSRRHELKPFTWNYADPTTTYTFRSFLKAWDLRLPLADRSKLGSTSLAARIHYATDGIVGYVGTLVREACMLAVKDGCEQIRLPHLSEAFVEHVQTSKPHKENPFTVEFFTPELLSLWRAKEAATMAVEPQEARRRRGKLRASEILRA